ncbi:hypothetical protein THRCLA_21461 [Thraustotheca clavata]|uniref:Uncharacterized protein n=1 Tax=Thraustotheca clavata TaxID=74557 RepID=A0A1V9ZW65_9STRA|nr:hypothetical protein THRCLA_21461 [Thraustotheca clavata]
METVAGGFDALNSHVRKLIAGILLVGAIYYNFEPDINVVSPFLTPLGVACDLNSPLLVDIFFARGGHPDIVRMILMSNADTTLQNNKGRSPLEEAKVASANRGVQSNTEINGAVAPSYHTTSS